MGLENRGREFEKFLGWEVRDQLVLINGIGKYCLHFCVREIYASILVSFMCRCCSGYTKKKVFFFRAFNLEFDGKKL